MVEYKIMKYGKDSVMITRREPMEKVFPGVPPYTTSTLSLKEKDIPDLINALSDYVQTEQRRDI